MSILSLSADATAAASPLHHHWNVCVGAGRANEGLRADWQEQLALVIDRCGFRYVRFHGLFHDDMFVYREKEDGTPVYNFQYIDTLFDRLLEMGIKPFIEFGFCPGDIASEKGTIFWWKGNGSPPADYDKWSALIRRTMEHWLARYGIEELRTWYYEVWNEPNLNPFFRGTKSQYFELYRRTVEVVKSIDPALRVGGPATSNFVPDSRFDGELEDPSKIDHAGLAGDLDALDWQPVWLRDFLAFCDREKLPVDFVSCHPYPTDWALDEHQAGTFKKTTRGVDATPRDLKLLRAIVDESRFPKAEIHLTEWSCSSSPRDFTHDFLQAATFVVKTNLESIGTVDSLSYWVFTDIFEEGGAGDEIFHGGFGMINVQGIVKPTFHAYRLLAGLGDELIACSECGVVTRDSSSGKIRALACHYPPQMPLSVPASSDTRDKAWETLSLGDPVVLEIDLHGLKPGAEVVIETLDSRHGNAMGAWEEMGFPAAPTREQCGVLREKAAATGLEIVHADGSGTLLIKRSIEPWSVVSIVEK
jgi:xylan 1,4-beta-xylosidase